MGGVGLGGADGRGGGGDDDDDFSSTLRLKTGVSRVAASFG